LKQKEPQHMQIKNASWGLIVIRWIPFLVDILTSIGLKGKVWEAMENQKYKMRNDQIMSIYENLTKLNTVLYFIFLS
jgi:hypothetical protein